MNPSEAKVLSSGISRLLSSKRHSDVSYSRLGQMDDSVEFSKVHFHKHRSSFCAKLCFSLLALMLLIATVGSALFIMNMKHFTVEVQLKQGNVRVYRFNQELTIVGDETTTRNVSIVVSMHLVNRTGSDCWFGIVLSLPKDKKERLSFDDFVFLTRVTSAEIDDRAQTRFKVFGKRKTSNELSFYVHNILRQLLPVIKVKLYEFVLSKVTSSSRRVVAEKQGFLPGRVHLKRTIITKDDVLTVMAKAGPGDFDNFSTSKGKESKVASWKLSYDETSVVSKKTGMVKKSDMSISGTVPLGADFDPKRGGSHKKGLVVTFRSIVRLLDESQVIMKHWKSMVKEENDISHPLSFPSVEQSSLVYFAPRKRKLNYKPQNDLLDLIKLSKDSTGRSTKLPKIINVMHKTSLKPSFVKSDLVDNDKSDDSMNDDETNDDGDNDNDNDDDSNENDDVDSDNQASWPVPNFTPFGLGYEVKRKRSVETKRTPRTNIIKTTRHKRLKNKSPELDIMWDELMSSTPPPNHEDPRVIQTSVLGLNFQAEIEYKVNVNDDGDEDDNDDEKDNDGYNDDNNNDDGDDDDHVGWDITTVFRVAMGQYRITPFRRVHTLEKIKGKLPPIGQRRSSHWVVNAGDFVSQKCII